MATIYTTIINEIKAILDGVGTISEVHSNPVSKFGSYPAAVFFPTSVENEFQTNKENMKLYNFNLYLICSATNSSVNKVYGEVMPDLVDEVLADFDSKWSLDSIDGHSVWVKIESGNWETSAEQQGLIVYGEFKIIIKVLTNN